MEWFFLGFILGGAIFFFLGAEHPELALKFKKKPDDPPSET